jgi:tetratricopeptide (TPR) repeat protein
MDSTERRLEETRQRLLNEVEQISRKEMRISRFAWLSIVLVTSIFVVGILFGRVYLKEFNVRLDSIESKLKSPSEQAVYHPPKELPETRDEFNSRLSSVETLMEAITNMSSKALEQMNFIFTIVAAFFGLFSIFFAVRQFISDEGKVKHDAEMIELVGSFRQNITVVNDLMNTMKESYNYRDKVENELGELRTDLLIVKDYKKRAEENLQEKILSLNKRAYQLFQEFDRDNFKREENRGKLEYFYDLLNAIEFSGEVEEKLNPFCFYLRGLRYFNATQYELAGKDLELSKKKASREYANPTLNKYGDAISDEIGRYLEKMLEDVEYHLGIIYYNVGDYKLARERFKEAFSKKHLDFRSRIYIPELMFFDNKIPFSQVIDEYNNVRKELEKLTSDERMKIHWEASMVSFLIRYGNCFLQKLIPLDHRRQYQSEENNEKATEIYWEAFDFIEKQGSKKPTLQETFVKFSLAQSLPLSRGTEWKGTSPNNLYRQVFYEIKKEIILKTEPILLMLLNYVLAICVNQGEINEENPFAYLTRSREYLQQIPVDVKIFSPINKINLSREEILKEIEDYERNFIHQKIKMS